MIYQSPSNIALIKYMGKRPHNIPVNTSLSYTLDSYTSGVQLIPISGQKDQWSPLVGKPWLPIQLSAKEKEKFLNFFQTLKKIFGLTQYYEVQSANNFHKSAGMASSASSFSALTKASYHQALSEGGTAWTPEQLSMVSRQGSGSSCRSFFKPWCVWDQKGARNIQLPFQKLLHKVIWMDPTEKKVPSSLAHQRVPTSPYFKGRGDRAEKRLKQLLQAFQQKNWKKIYLIVKEEFEDMHRLFETSQPAFSYRNDKTQQVLEKVDQYWKENQDGPLVTMDAGANVHLLYQPHQKWILFE